MKPIAHEAYAAPATFQQELERIFQPGMFVATADKLAARHAYVSCLLETGRFPSATPATDLPHSRTSAFTVAR
jgi:hypothetical protein